VKARRRTVADLEKTLREERAKLANVEDRLVVATNRGAAVGMMIRQGKMFISLISLSQHLPATLTSPYFTNPPPPLFLVV
jgi:hypothetical protein